MVIGSTAIPKAGEAMVKLNRAGRRKIRFAQRSVSRAAARKVGGAGTIPPHVSAGPSEKAVGRILREYAA